MADVNDYPRQPAERLAPVNDAALRRSIADLQSVVNDGVLLDEIENWPGFAESLGLCLHELRRLQAEAASAQPATRLAPLDWDVQMLRHGVLLGCPCCNGTPSTFSRQFAHSGIYQSYVHCSRCDMQVFKNARTLEEARQLAVAAWSMRPDMRAAGEATPTGKVDWLKVARLAGEHGVRYRTNTALLKFLEAVAYPPKTPTGDDAGAVQPTKRELTYAFLKLRLSEKREVAKTLGLPDPYRVDAGLDQDKAFLRIVFDGDRTSDLAAALAPYMPVTQPVRKSTKSLAPSGLTSFLLGGTICSLLAVLVQAH